MSSSLTDVLLPHRPAQALRPVAVTEGEYQSLLVALAAVPDPRDRRGTRYSLVSVLAVAVCAVLAGAATFAAIGDWVQDLDPGHRAGWDSPGGSRRLPRCGGS